MPVPILKKIFPLLLAVLFAGPSCRADQSSLAEAEKLYQSGEIQKARAIYQTELAAVPNPDKLSASFFFNYGTVLARTGATGEAYVSLLRASFSAPFDGDTRHNLWRIEQAVPMTVRSVQPALWLGFWPRALRSLPWQLWLIAGLALSAAALWAAKGQDRTVAWSLSAVSAILLLIGTLALLQARLPVVGVMKIAQVKSGPGLTFTDITTLEPGSLANEDGNRDGWRKIRFRKGETEETVGWVQPAALLEVF